MKHYLFLLTTSLCSFLEGSLSDEQIEFFESKIRPVLAESCYECHNSVDKKKGDIALDYRQSLLDSNIIVPGKPEQSPLLLAIKHSEDFKAMPSKAPKLSNLTIQHFEEWILMGAPDPRLEKPSKKDLENQVDWDSVRNKRAEWWSFQAIKKTTPPKADHPEWNQSPIDQFVFNQLKSNGLKPEAKTDPANLIRRVYLTLIGHPPPPEIVLSYAKNPTSEAYHHIVDKLLASPRFGERWGRYWLDWFRYAESHGSEGDPTIPYASEYRNYIIRSLNGDIPYDTLLHEHLAGDLLDQPRINHELGINESAIGTAHLRMVPHGFGVTDAYQEQVTFTDNQIDALTKATMAMTVSCARCHNHKFDPISQADFYKFYGIMVSSRPGTINIDSPEFQNKHRESLLELKGLIKEELADYWLKQAHNAIQRLTTLQGPVVEEIKKQAHHPLHAWFALKDQDDLETGWAQLTRDHQQRVEKKKKAIAQATFYANLGNQNDYDQWFKNGTGLSNKVSPAGSFSIAFEGPETLSGIYPSGVYSHLLSSKDNATLGSVFHKAQGSQTSVLAIGENSTARFSPRSYPLSFGLHPAPTLKKQFSWVNLGKYDYWNGDQVYYQLVTGPDQTFRHQQGRAWFGLTEVIAGNERFSPVGHPAVALETLAVESSKDLLEFYQRHLQSALSQWKNNALTDAQAALLDALRIHCLPNKVQELPETLKKQIERYRKLEASLRNPRRAPGVLEAEPWDQPLLVRGSHQNEAQPVPRGFLEVFGGEQYPKTTSGRLELAHDLTNPKNPLTTRVIVNRLWHHTFGRGLVATTNNFGRLGKRPSHPELLDYLAQDFVADGWSIKKALRKLVTSRTFFSSSQVSSTNHEKDPENLYLSHFSPRRLDAEAIYDTINHLTGGSDRAAIYSQVIRNRLDPFLSAFNAPIPTTSVGVRDDTNVPAQTLMLLNGDFALRSAANWAQVIEKNYPQESIEAKIRQLFLQSFSRKPTPEELEACQIFLKTPPDQRGLVELNQQVNESESHLLSLQKKRHKLTKKTRERLEAELREQSNQETPVDLKPFAEWTFDQDYNDSLRGITGTMQGQGSLENGALTLKGGALFTSPIQTNLTEKSFEVLVQLDSLNQRGGGLMTLQTLDGHTFDSIVLGELNPQQWITGSDFHRRTLPFGTVQEETAHHEPIRLLFVYQRDGTIQAYRNGIALGQPIRKGPPVTFQKGQAQIVFGLRHGTSPEKGRALTGKVFEARLYDRALSPEEALAANTGRMIPMVRESDVLSALPNKTRQQVIALDEAINEQSQNHQQLKDSLADAKNTHARAPQGFARLTHALLNSKELIYVY